VDQIGFTKSAFDFFTALPAEVQARYEQLILGLAEDPYAWERFPTAQDSVYDRVIDTGDGWIRYRVRPLAHPEIKVMEMHCFGAE
jgi:hypothetical protein